MTRTPKEIKIKTPCGSKNWSFVKKCIENHDELVEALKHAHNSLRTFRNVPKDEQEWTSIDDDTIKTIEQALAKAEA
jgi:hypothetical protein